MTLKRQQYLASISKEEQIIRGTISMLKDYIGSYKGYKWSDDEKHLHRVCIRNLKFRIRLLKKQLPAPVKFVRDGEWYYNSCSVCKGAINEDELYCHTCGQKLR